MKQRPLTRRLLRGLGKADRAATRWMRAIALLRPFKQRQELEVIERFCEMEIEAGYFWLGYVRRKSVGRHSDAHGIDAAFSRFAHQGIAAAVGQGDIADDGIEALPMEEIDAAFDIFDGDDIVTAAQQKSLQRLPGILMIFNN
jgi:hypothetical protein